MPATALSCSSNPSKQSPAHPPKLPAFQNNPEQHWDADDRAVARRGPWAAPMRVHRVTAGSGSSCLFSLQQGGSPPTCEGSRPQGTPSCLRLGLALPLPHTGLETNPLSEERPSQACESPVAAMTKGHGWVT